MKVAKVQQVLDAYVSQRLDGLDESVSLKSAVDRFASNWDFERPDFTAMIKEALDTKLESYLWPNSHVPFIEVLFALSVRNPVAIKQMFLDLFYPRVLIQSRIEHFRLECDENFKMLIQEVGNKYRKHFNDNVMNITFYLHLKSPSEVPVMHYDNLIKYLSFVEAKNIPIQFDFENQIKQYNILGKLASNRFEGNVENPLTLASEIVYFFDQLKL